MKKSAASDKQQFHRELAEYRAILEQHSDALAENSLLSSQFIFLMESAKFYIAQLDVWEKVQIYKDMRKQSREREKSLTLLSAK